MTFIEYYHTDEGFTTFDLADHYGPAEDYVGFFSKGRLSGALAKECQVRSLCSRDVDTN